MRHFHSKSDNFVKLQTFCKEEIKKKNQYKQELYRIRTEYKRKCEEAAELRARLGKMQNCTLNLNDMTHDPFRTPISGRPPDQRSFLTSTPYGNHKRGDISESTISAMRQTSDSTSSFAAFGIPVVSMDSDGEHTDVEPCNVGHKAQPIFPSNGTGFRDNKVSFVFFIIAECVLIATI
ncbi:unnamed protein product [Strongylus vulgaris]|uniref:Uncharacterized protein n=1 Tax=Strongylus vulgaris TaxID=40348 RepID=A0A3P7IY87_STRVU|nr:unnamed protein product [Strongylus vulgaris]